MKKSIQRFRLVVQIVVLVIVSYVAFMHQYAGGGPGGAPNIHSICPFGGVEAIYKLAASGEFIKKLNTSNMVVLGGSILLTLLLSRYFCGWICAMGTMQELFERLAKKLKIKRVAVPQKIDTPLRYLKYINLVGITFFTWKAGELIIHPYDPFAAYAHIPAGFADLMDEYFWGVLILGISLFASMIIPRFFCRYACPLGAFLGIIHKISPFRIRREKDTCTSCSLCNKKCPVDIPVVAVDSVKSAECIACFECVTSCPTKKETLVTTLFGKKINLWVVAVLGVLIYFGTIGVANMTGYWKQLPDSVTEAVGGNPNNIRGWMTLEQVSKEFQIPLREIYENIGVSRDDLPETTQIKKMEAILTEKGIEFDHDEIGTIVEQILGDRLIGSVVQEESGFSFRGKMSINDVAKALNISAEEVCRRAGLPADAALDVPIKDIAEENALDMEPIKSALEAGQ